MGIKNKAVMGFLDSVDLYGTEPNTFTVKGR